MILALQTTGLLDYWGGHAFRNSILRSSITPILRAQTVEAPECSIVPSLHCGHPLGSNEKGANRELGRTLKHTAS